MSELVTDFDRFWHAYPRRTAKGTARKAWQKLAPDAALVERILEALVWQTRQSDWLRDNGTYIPYPASWLRAERWDDEAPRAAQVAAVERSYGFAAEIAAAVKAEWGVH